LKTWNLPELIQDLNPDPHTNLVDPKHWIIMRLSLMEHLNEELTPNILTLFYLPKDWDSNSWLFPDGVLNPFPIIDFLGVAEQI